MWKIIYRNINWHFVCRCTELYLYRLVIWVDVYETNYPYGSNVHWETRYEQSLLRRTRKMKIKKLYTEIRLPLNVMFSDGSDGSCILSRRQMHENVIFGERQYNGKHNTKRYYRRSIIPLSVTRFDVNTLSAGDRVQYSSVCQAASQKSSRTRLLKKRSWPPLRRYPNDSFRYEFDILNVPAVH